MIQISAQYGGSDVKLAADFAFGVTNKSPEFTAKFPFGQVCKKFRITITFVNTLFAEMRYQGHFLISSDVLSKAKK